MRRNRRELSDSSAPILSPIAAAQEGAVYDHESVVSPVRLVRLLNQCQRPEGSTAILRQRADNYII